MHKVNETLVFTLFDSKLSDIEKRCGVYFFAARLEDRGSRVEGFMSRAKVPGRGSR